MLTGELPLGRFAPPSETQGVDPRWDNVVFRTLEKQVDKRYQSAGEVQTQVETIAGSATPNADAAFSKATPEPSDNALKEDAALAFPPSWTTAVNWILRQPFLFQRGVLRLEEGQFVYVSSKATLAIPLASIGEVSLAPLSFSVEPLARCPVNIRWRDASKRQQVTSFLLGSSSWATRLPLEQGNTDSWVRAIREAVKTKTGTEPSCAHDVDLTAEQVTPPLPTLSRHPARTRACQESKWRMRRRSRRTKPLIVFGQMRCSRVRLEADCVSEGKAKQFEILQPWLAGGADRPQADAAFELSMSESAVRVAIHRMRQRFRKAVLGELAQTVAQTFQFRKRCSTSLQHSAAEGVCPRRRSRTHLTHDSLLLARYPSCLLELC